MYSVYAEVSGTIKQVMPRYINMVNTLEKTYDQFGFQLALIIRNYSFVGL